MMTTNLFVIANVKQLRTGGSFKILLPFFRTSLGVGVLNSSIFNNFHNRVEFEMILEGLRNFGGFETLTPPLGTPLRGKVFTARYGLGVQIRQIQFRSYGFNDNPFLPFDNLHYAVRVWSVADDSFLSI